MRYIFYLGFSIFTLLFMTTPTINDLTNTSWTGILNAPEPADATLKFSDDKFYVFIDTTLIETSNYSVSNDTLILKKVQGRSPCNYEIGKYTYTITNDVLNIRPISDVCEARFFAFTPLGYKKEN